MAKDRKLHNQVGASHSTIKEPCTDPETIGKDITLALHRSKSFPKTIDVGVEGNEVRLTGSVLSLQDKKRWGWHR